MGVVEVMVVALWKVGEQGEEEGEEEWKAGVGQAGSQKHPQSGCPAGRSTAQSSGPHLVEWK
jgi:hypothetical protein